MVADNPKVEGDARLGGVAKRRRHAGIRHRDDDIGGHAGLTRQFGADGLARAIDAGALDDAVGTGEIDIFENAKPPRPIAEGEQRGDALGVDHHHLASLDVAHELGANDVQGAGFRGQNMGVTQAAQHQRPHAARVAHTDHRPLGQADQGIGPLDLMQGVDDAVVDGRLMAARD